MAVRARAANHQMLIRISDHGPGIAKEDLERVFEPFLRASGEDGSGSGLGLAIARGFLEANGGRIRAESLPGQGASFVIQLPWTRGADTPERRAAGARGGRRARRSCARCGSSSATPASRWPPRTPPQEALDALAVRPPDAAIIDLILPDGNGVDICRSIREWSEMPVIVLSAVGEEAEKVRALEAGADDYVTKPFGPDELIARLRAALRRAGATRRTSPCSPRPASSWTWPPTGSPWTAQEVHLTPTEYDLLRVLMQRRGRLMTHRSLLAEVWGPGYEDDTQVLRVHVANLRRKIEPEPATPRYVVTDPGVGLPLRRLSAALHDIFIAGARGSSRGLDGTGADAGLSHGRSSPSSIGSLVFAAMFARARGARPGMSAAELFGLLVSAAGLRLPALRAPAR